MLIVVVHLHDKLIQRCYDSNPCPANYELRLSSCLVAFPNLLISASQRSGV